VCIVAYFDAYRKHKFKKVVSSSTKMLWANIQPDGCDVGMRRTPEEDIMGGSPSMAVRMAKDYGHIGATAPREAVEKLANAPTFDSEGAKMGTVAQFREGAGGVSPRKIDGSPNVPVY